MSLVLAGGRGVGGCEGGRRRASEQLWVVAEIETRRGTRGDEEVGAVSGCVFL